MQRRSVHCGRTGESGDVEVRPPDVRLLLAGRVPAELGASAREAGLVRPRRCDVRFLVPVYTHRGDSVILVSKRWLFQRTTRGCRRVSFSIVDDCHTFFGLGMVSRQSKATLYLRMVLPPSRAPSPHFSTGSTEGCMAWRLGGGGSRQPGLSTPRSMIPPVFFRAVAHASSIAAESNSGEGNPSLFATVCTKHCVPFRFDAGGAVRRKAQFVVRGACALQQTAMHSVGVV